MISAKTCAGSFHLGKSVLKFKRTLKTHRHIFALFLQTVYAIEKLLTGLNNVQPRIGMN